MGGVVEEILDAISIVLDILCHGMDYWVQYRNLLCNSDHVDDVDTTGNVCLGEGSYEVLDFDVNNKLSTS